MKKGMLFGLSHREKRVKKMNLLHFLVFTLKNFLILELPEHGAKSWVCQKIARDANPLQTY